MNANVQASNTTSRFLLTRALAIAAVLGSGASVASSQEPSRTFTNPILPSGPDPWIVRHGSVYYYMNTLSDRLAIRATRDVTRLRDAPEVVVWRPPAAGPNAQSIWAPELHRIGGKWYVYYTAAASGHDDDAHRGIFVLENEADNPIKGTWTDRGQLKTNHAGIDGTTFTHQGKRYFAYSAYVGADSVLALSKMKNPWTLEGKEVVIARPDRTWERQGGRQIVEGPEYLQGPRGDMFITYSGSACWSDDYAIGLLHAAPSSDPLDAASWTKNSAPVIAKNPDESVYAPGHNGFFVAGPELKTWIVYHANPEPGLGCTAKRSPRIQQVIWTRNGAPKFTKPTGTGHPLLSP